MDALLKKTIDATIETRCPNMSLESRQMLCDIVMRKELHKGEILLKEGEVSHDFVLVGEGMVRQFYYKNKKDITEHFTHEGGVAFCIESILQQVPTKLMIEALENCVVYLMPYNKLMTLTEISPEINLYYRGILEFSLIVSQIKANSWRFETAHQRYQTLLEHQPEVLKRAPLYHIASYLQMTPETLSRVRSGVL